MKYWYLEVLKCPWSFWNLLGDFFIPELNKDYMVFIRFEDKCVLQSDLKELTSAVIF